MMMIAKMNGIYVLLAVGQDEDPQKKWAAIAPMNGSSSLSRLIETTTYAACVVQMLMQSRSY